MRKSSPQPSEENISWLTRIWQLRTVRRVVKTVAVLAIITAIIWVEENFRGKHDWEVFKKQQEAKGEKLDWASFIPPAVPDDQNFAMTPFLASLYDFDAAKNPSANNPSGTNAAFDTSEIGKRISGSWFKGQYLDLNTKEKNHQAPPIAPPPATRTTDAQSLLQLLTRYQPIVEELTQAGQRPYARFNVPYDNPNVTGISFVHLSAMKKISILFEARACAELALGKNEHALQDTKMVMRSSDALTNEPFLISGLVRIAMMNLSIQPIWEGLAAHRWTDAQLGDLEQTLGAKDLLGEYEKQMRGERAFGLAALEYMRVGGAKAMNETYQTKTFISMPSGWFYQNEIAGVKMFENAIFPSVDPDARRVYPAMYAKNQAAESRRLSTGFMPTKIFAAIILPALAKAEIKYAQLQAYIDEARTACALERYFLAHREYPKSLEALVPQFIAKLPADLFTGDPLKYRRTDKDKFLLYSVGWDEKDDGGSVAIKNNGNDYSIDPLNGDWVWPQYP